jgi:hypothetical protein
MGYITLSILIITFISLLSCTLLGLWRGRNRSLLRFGLIILSIILAFSLKGVFANIILDINIQGEPIRDMLLNTLSSGDVTLSSGLETMAITIVELLIGIIMFIILFALFNLLTFSILYPIGRIFVKTEFPRQRLWGVGIGFIQGLIISFIICVPLTGIVVQADRISQTQFQGESLFEIPSEIGVHEYATSLPAKFYNSTGQWFFDVLSTKKDENGNKIAINDVCDIAVTVINTADVLDSVSNDLQNIDFSNSTPQEQVESMKKLGDALIQLGSSIDTLSDDAKVIVQEVFTEAKNMFANEDGVVPEEIESIFDNIDVEKLKLDSAGEAMNGIASYIEKTSDEFDNNEPVTQEEVNNIINGLADNTFVLDMIDQDTENSQIVNVAEEDKSKFETAINNSTLSDEYKNMLNQMFGLKE